MTKIINVHKVKTFRIEKLLVEKLINGKCHYVLNIKTLDVDGVESHIAFFSDDIDTLAIEKGLKNGENPHWNM